MKGSKSPLMKGKLLKEPKKFDLKRQVTVEAKVIKKRYSNITKA